MSFAARAIKYFNNLNSAGQNTGDVDIVNPYANNEVKDCVSAYYKKFYSDNNDRIFIIGINPGRFGGGLTGISFTDPVALKEHCGIDNQLGNQKELSSKFIYSVINEFGGPQLFFSKAFLTALYPFALVKHGKNFNYYDDKNISAVLKNEITQNINSQMGFGANRDFAVILGKKNAEYFYHINKEYNFFKEFVVLEHPRYIMQYKLKQMNNFLNKYLQAIR